jgi:DNA topoisomerase-1
VATGPDPSLVRHARRAGLRYVSADEPGLTRKGAGTGFAYYLPDGSLLRDRQTRARIQALAIPPAYSDVWICADPRGHIQATGRDDKGRKQYRYHADWHAARSETKFARLPEFGRALPLLRRRVAADLEAESLSRAHVLAVASALLDRTLLRVGGAEYASENNSYGLTTLRDRHARLRPGGVTFAFEGKSGQDHEVDVDDPALAAHVKACRDVPGYHLFQYFDADGARCQLDSADLNAYLRDAMGEAFTAKDFRTWGGTLAAATAAYAAPDNEPPPETIKRSIEAACAALGNTEAVCREYYLHPAVSAAVSDGTFREAWSRARSGGVLGGLTRDEDALVRFVEDVG